MKNSNKKSNAQSKTINFKQIIKKENNYENHKHYRHQKDH